MCCCNKGPSGIVISMSRGTGACVGTIAFAGKKITGVVADGVKSVGNLLARPFSSSDLTSTEQTESTPEVFALEAKSKENSAKPPICSSESDLAAARKQLADHLIQQPLQCH